VTTPVQQAIWHDLLGEARPRPRHCLDRSYFFGCSEGGREALIEAQRFPQDFDGIVAGAPAQHRTDLLTGFVPVSPDGPVGRQGQGRRGRESQL
jgi:hypothetical protein